MNERETLEAILSMARTAHDAPNLDGVITAIIVVAELGLGKQEEDKHPACCPYCGCTDVSWIGPWTSYPSLDVDAEEPDVTQEYQCRNEDCGRSFWVWGEEE